MRCAEALAVNHHTQLALGIYDQLRGLPLPRQVQIAAWRGAILTRKDGLPLLIKALRSGDFPTFATAIRDSYEMPGPAVTLALAGQLDKTNTDMRLLLTETLGLRGDPSALPALARAAETGDTSIRVAALRALAQLCDSAAGTVLLGLWADSNHDVAQAAQAALVALPGKAIDASILALLASLQCFVGDTDVATGRFDLMAARFQLFRHAVERLHQFGQFVGGPNIDTVIELAFRNCLRPRRQRRYRTID